MSWRSIRSLALLLGLTSAALPLCGQRDRDHDVMVALDRWTRSFLNGGIDVTRPTPIDKDAPSRVPVRLLGTDSQRLTELQALELLLRAAAEAGTHAAAERLVRLGSVGLEPKSARLQGAVIVRGAAEAALDECSSVDVHAHLLDLVRGKSRSEEEVALRIAAARALGSSAQPVFWPMLVDLLRDAEPRLRAAAARALGDLGRPQAINPMAQALREEREAEVVQAITLSLRDLLEIAERDGSLDPLAHLDAIRAVVGALERTKDWRVAADLVRFLDRHRAPDAVPVLIEILASTDAPAGTGTKQPRGSPFLKHEAHRVLKAMTGAVLGAEDIERWRELWNTEKDSIRLVPRKDEQLAENATVAGGFFGIPVLGQRVVFVIDCSGSMVAPAPQANETAAGPGSVPTRLDIAKRECWNAVKGMGPHTYFNVVVFASRARAWKDDLVAATPENKGALRNHLQRLIADGSTNLWDGLSTALAMRTAMTPSRYREPVDEVFVLSDGYPSSGEVTDAATIAARVREQNKHVGIRLNTVFIGSLASDLDAMAQPGGNALMRVLADQNSGTFVER